MIVAGCAGTGPTSTEEATEILEQTLADRQFVSYRNLQRYPGDVVCGEYQALDPWGGNQGYRPFAVVKGTAYQGLDKTGVAVFCSRDCNSSMLVTGKPSRPMITSPPTSTCWPLMVTA